MRSMREDRWEVREALGVDPSAAVEVVGVTAISSGPCGSGEEEEA